MPASAREISSDQLTVASRWFWRLTVLWSFAIVGALPASAQDVTLPVAPVIAAPSDAGRAAPALPGQPTSYDTGSLNSFAANSGSDLPLDGFMSPSLPIVVELFTSQGCSSCPAADAMLQQLTQEPGVLPLSLHVDYWDYLGWKDSFARPEFTARQEAYARAAGERSVYTPQLIIGGKDTAVAPSPAQLLALIDAQRAAPALITINREKTEDGYMIEILPLSELGGMVSVSLIRYVPERKVQIKSGENRGREITYINVVLSMNEVTEWDGAAPLRLNIRLDDEPSATLPNDARSVILVQRELQDQDLPGPVLATIALD